MSRAKWCLSALLLTGVGSLIAFGVTPPTFTKSEIKWSPQTAADGGYFNLSRGWPESLDITTTCLRVANFKDGNLLDLGGLVIFSSDSSLVVESPIPAIFSYSANLPKGDCDIQVSFRSDLGTLSTKINGELKVHYLAESAFPRISKLIIPATSLPTIAAVTITTRPTGISHQGIRLLYFFISLLVFFVLTIHIVIGDKKKWGKHLFHLPHIFLVDVFVMLTLSSAAFLIPPLVDDGWVWQSLTGFSGRGVFSNYYENLDAWKPQGYVNEFFLHWLISLGLSFFWLKLVIALMLSTCWIAIRSVILVPFFGKSNLILLPCAAMWVTFSSVWLISLRAEPWVVLCSVISLISLASFNQSQRYLSLVFCLTSSGLALCLHQTGWTVLSTAIVAIFIAWRRDKNKLGSYYLVLAVSVSIGLVFLVFFLPMDLQSLLNNAREFSSSSHSGGGPFFEWKRYFYLIGDETTSGARVFSIFVLGLFAYLSATISSKFNGAVRPFWYCTILSPLLLSLTSSKWTWHFGVLLVPAVISVVFVSSAFLSSDLPINQKRFTSSGVISLLTVLAGSAISISNHWGYYDFSKDSWELFSTTFGPVSKGPFWLLLIIAIVTFMQVASKRHVHFVSIITSVILILPLSLSYVWIVKDAPSSPHWSYFKQNLNQFLGHDTCGALDNLNVIENPLPLNVIEIKISEANKTDGKLSQNAYPNIPGVMGSPAPGLAIWGSWFVGSNVNKGIPSFISSNFNTGAFQSPTYIVEDLQELGVWSATGNLEKNRAEGVFLNDDFSILVQKSVKFSASSKWALNVFKVPKGSRYFRVLVHDDSDSVGGWGAVSSAFSFKKLSMTDLVADSVFFIGPYVRLRYPCVHLPIPRDGYWPRIDYLISDATHNGFANVQPDTAVEAGCSKISDACVDKIDYRMAKVSVFRITGTK